MPSPQAIDPPTPVTVNTTTTVLATFDTRNTETLSVQVENLDVTSTINCTIQRRVTGTSSFADTLIPDLQGITPGSKQAVDIGVGGNAEFRIIGTATPASASAAVCGRDKPRGRA